MARNDIQFAQARQADFSQANQMALAAQLSFDNALNQVKQTVTDFDKAVSARTTAKAKSMIDALFLEDWQTPEKRQALSDELTAYRNSVGGIIDDAALQSYQQSNLKRLYDDKNAGIEHSINQNTLTKDKLLTQDKVHQDDATTLTANVRAIDQALANLSGNDPHRATLEQQKQALIDGANNRTLMYSQDQLRDRDLSDLNHETQLAVAKDEYNQANLLDFSASLSPFTDQLSRVQSQKALYAFLPDTDPNKREAINQLEQQSSETLKGLMKSVASLPAHLQPRALAMVTQSLNEHDKTHRTNYGTMFQNMQHREAARQFDVAATQRAAEAARKQEIEEANLAIRTGELQLKAYQATNEGRSSSSDNTSSSGLNKDSYLYKTFGNQAINPDGSLNGNLIHNQLNRVAHDTLSNQYFAEDISDADYQKFKTGDLQKLKQIHSDRLFGLGLGFDSYVKSVEEFRFNGRPLTNGEKKAVLSELATSTVPFFKFDTTQIGEHINRLVLTYRASREKTLMEGVSTTLGELSSLGFSRKDIIQALNLTPSTTYYRYLPQDFKEEINLKYADRPKRTIGDYVRDSTSKETPARSPNIQQVSTSARDLSHIMSR